jgi:hypothetical protein
MRNKIIAGIIVVLALSIIKMGLDYVLKAEECKADLETFKQIEIQNKKQIIKTNEKIKTIRKKLIDNPNIEYRRKLLEKINPSK